MKLFDISLPIHPDMIVYPGNPKPTLAPFAVMPQASANISLLTLGTHTGTHVDALLHIQAGGPGTVELPLSACYGPCRVLDLTRAGEEISRAHLAPCKIKKSEILLFKTQNSLKPYEVFREDFTHLSLPAAQYLAERKIKTLGVDYLSVKKFHVNDGVHEALLHNGITIFEGLYLKEIKPGNYLFCGLPLNIQSDGAPARAILIKN